MDGQTFWVDPGSGRTRSYTDLIDDLNSRREAPRVIQEGDPPEIFTRFLEALVRGVPVTLVDPELTPSERRALGVADEQAGSPVAAASGLGLAGLDDLRRRVRDSSATVYLSTSGTTGVPKRVGQGVPALTRTARIGERFERDVWGFAYHPMHFAGLQVFFQAFLNLNPMVDLREVQGQAFSRAVDTHGVTHLSATPTFYRRLLAGAPAPMERVRRVTFGGERFDPTIVEEIRHLFPGARLRNLYASTEAGSLFAADDEIFRATSETAGRYRITDDGELLLHVSVLGDFERTLIDGEWFPTGDIVERIGEDAFRFLSRLSDTINVGGYKVNPHEVEEVIRRVAGVQDVVVRGRASRVTGNILEAEVVIQGGQSQEALETAIRTAAASVLQPYKVPRLYRFVDAISSTRTGKKART